MSKSEAPELNPTVELPEPSENKPTLATIVTKSLPYEVLPSWKEYRTASWAIQNTIERVAPEAR